jgi:hypothetical protein
MAKLLFKNLNLKEDMVFSKVEVRFTENLHKSQSIIN